MKKVDKFRFLKYFTDEELKKFLTPIFERYLMPNLYKYSIYKNDDGFLIYCQNRYDETDAIIFTLNDYELFVLSDSNVFAVEFDKIHEAITSSLSVHYNEIYDLARCDYTTSLS